MKFQSNSESEFRSDLKVTRECDIFNDDSAEIIELKDIKNYD